MSEQKTWHIGQQVLFLDDRVRPSDDNMKRMPELGEVCTIRTVIESSTNYDTGKPCVGLYLDGYTNPLPDKNSPEKSAYPEYCYEAERFVPVEAARQLLQNETSWTADDPPNPQSLGVSKFIRNIADHLEENEMWHQVNLQKGILDARLSSRWGEFSYRVRYLGQGRFVSTIRLPVRHSIDYQSRVWQLIDLMNDDQWVGKFKSDVSRNMVFFELKFMYSDDPNYPIYTLHLGMSQANRLFRPFTDLLFRGLDPVGAAVRQYGFDEHAEEPDLKYPKPPNLNKEIQDRFEIYNLMTGFPEDN